MGEVFKGLSREILPSGQDKYLKRKDYQFSTKKGRNHSGCMGALPKIQVMVAYARFL
jgi:hypothetical protein